MAPDRMRLGTYISSLLKDGYKRTQIENYLIEHGHNGHLVKELVTETIKIHRSRIILKALAVVMAGVIICMLCMVYTTMPSYNQNPIP